MIGYYAPDAQGRVRVPAPVHGCEFCDCEWASKKGDSYSCGASECEALREELEAAA